MNEYVNGELIRMADSLREQLGQIEDWDDEADERRMRLHRAIAHLHLAFAELSMIPFLRGVAVRSMTKTEQSPAPAPDSAEASDGFEPMCHGMGSPDDG